jgi:transposase
VKNEGLLGHILPSELLDHFSIDWTQGIKNKEGVVEIEIALTEKNVLPIGYAHAEYESKGFYAAKRIQDFPLRGKAVYLLVKRRRWRHKLTKKEIKGDYSFITEGSKLTTELADFLKGTGRDPSRYG